MDYNPFTQEQNRLRVLLERKRIKRGGLTEELAWFDSTDLSKLATMTESMEKLKTETLHHINESEKSIATLQEKLISVRRTTGTLLNPFNWFDEDQKIRRRSLRHLRLEAGEKTEHLNKSKASLSETISTIDSLRKEAKKHKAFDRQAVFDETVQLKDEIFSLEEDYKRASELKINADKVLRPVIDQIKKYESSISREKEKISKARTFERKLETAYNSYEKAMVHQECEKLLGEGSPKKVIRQSESQILRLERDLEKSKKRAIQIRVNVSRDIRKVIIDGNNMCYENGKFVGLPPVIESTKELQRKYKVIIIFDAAIRSQIKAGNQEIRGKFDHSVDVHVVATKQLADETILDIASNDDSCYIISNDRFGEYQEKAAVKDDRLIRHEVVSGNVLIHGLNINVAYETEEAASA